jgi:hypothetical protein
MRLRRPHNNSSSPNAIPSWSRRLPQSVHGKMLRTGVNMPSDFAPERLS